jgi:hypothetical protein
MLQVYRRNTRWESFSLDGDTLLVSHPSPELILCFTDNWSIRGNRADWGLEPLAYKLREMDGWNRDVYTEFDKQRERLTENKARSRRNEFKALAYDLRRDFAKATNDINTGSLEKVDRRRKKEM